eukprot:928214-Karenia_brevis.AAC.1
MVRCKGSKDEYVMQVLLTWIGQLGFARAEIKCDHEPSTLDVRNALIARCATTTLVPKETPK